MKLEQVAHKHTLTGILKVLLFALLMLAPIFSVASRCLYVICNKNAYQSYANEYVEEKVDVNNVGEFIIGNVYTFDNSVYATGSISYVSMELIDITTTNTSISTIINSINELKQYYYRFSLFVSGDYFDFAFYSNDTNNAPNRFIGHGVAFTFTYKYLGVNGNLEGILNNTKQIKELKNNTLDNVFTYSVNEMENDQLFNWTKNTAIYTGINTMTTGIGINQEAIPILLTYWFLLTVIYVIVDIIINTFTLLTHFIQKKTS